MNITTRAGLFFTCSHVFTFHAHRMKFMMHLVNGWLDCESLKWPFNECWFALLPGVLWICRGLWVSRCPGAFPLQKLCGSPTSSFTVSLFHIKTLWQNSSHILLSSPAEAIPHRVSGSADIAKLVHTVTLNVAYALLANKKKKNIEKNVKSCSQCRNIKG